MILKFISIYQTILLLYCYKREYLCFPDCYYLLYRPREADLNLNFKLIFIYIWISIKIKQFCFFECKECRAALHSNGFRCELIIFGTHLRVVAQYLGRKLNLPLWILSLGLISLISNIKSKLFVSLLTITAIESQTVCLWKSNQIDQSTVHW